MADPSFTSELACIPVTEALSCDVLVVGCGAAGIAAAYGLEGSKLDVLVLESGDFEESLDAEGLNEVLVEENQWSEAQALRRNTYHAPQLEFWRHEHQGYGVRCRGIGGSTLAWAGKSAAFDALDFVERPWVPGSGWPIKLKDLEHPLERAAKLLNLHLNCYDDQLWNVIGRTPPEPRPNPAVLGSFFWQFARSNIEPMDVMRLGSELLHHPPRECRVITGATTLRVICEHQGARASGVVAADAAGRERHIHAKAIILAASTIENARILLNSNQDQPAGLGNAHDTVGRYLMDHPGAVIGHFDTPDIAQMARLYGFYSVKRPKGVGMYMRGVAPTREAQEAEGLLNCAAYMPGERSPDNPWDAAKRILKRRSSNYTADAFAILKSPGLVATGLGRIALQRSLLPDRLARFIVEQVVRFRPGFAAEEYLTDGVPHKLLGLSIEAICEQVPEASNRITLSRQTDRFGCPLPQVTWRVGETERRSLARFGQMIRAEFAKAGLPSPILDDWVMNDRLDDVAIIDMAHSCGTTRMSSDPRRGTVNADCQVHGVEGLYVAGGSVFPTSGHANPTLMIVAMAFRLTDHIRARFQPR